MIEDDLASTEFLLKEAGLLLDVATANSLRPAERVAWTEKRNVLIDEVACALGVDWRTDSGIGRP